MQEDVGKKILKESDRKKVFKEDDGKNKLKEDDEKNVLNEDDDQYLAAIGDCGKWQIRCFLVSGLFSIPTAWHVLIMTFMNAKVDSWCARPPELSHLDVNTWKNISGQPSIGQRSCQVYNRSWADWREEDGGSQRFGMADCTEWEFDKTQFTNTITGEFNLVCGDEYLISTSQTLYFIGMIFGVFTFGLLADLFGRKTVLIPILVGASLSGIATSLMPTFMSFAAGRVVNAFFVIGIFEVHFTYCIELVGGKWSTILGMGMEFFWVAGWLTLAVIAYFIRSWRTLTLLISIPQALSVLLIWLIPDSPRWLIATGRLKKAEEVIRSAAIMNGQPLPESWALRPVNKQEKKTKTNILHLFKTRLMATKVLIIYFNFFVNAFLYFGLTFNIGDLGGDVFLNFAISGLLEIPAYGLAMIVLLKYGRRVPYGSALILSGMFLLAISLVPTGVYYRDWPRVGLALLGKTCVTFSFGALFVYSAELVPTEIRTSAIGSASFLGRIGGIIAPWIGNLSEVHPSLPTIIFGVSALLAGFISFFLPETKGKPLPYTIEEAEILKLSNVWPKKWRRNQ